MSGSSSQRLREDIKAETSVSGRQAVRLRVGLLQEGVLGIIAIAQVATDQRVDVEVVNGMEILANLPWTAYRGTCRRKEAFASIPSWIYRGELRLMVESFQFSSDHQILVPAVTDRAAYPPRGFIAISRHHLIPGLRFPISGFLIDVLNLLKFASMLLTPSSYGQLLTLYLSFRKYGIPPPSDNVIKYYFVLKQCPLGKGSPEDALHDGMHYLSVQAGKYRDLL
ncbi:hypothetical protein ACOSP7_025426 [Xanthoceras sorbifolium]